MGSVENGVQVIRDVPYAGVKDNNRALNLYLPPHPPAKPLPVVVLIHGGGWSGGDKNDFNGLLNKYRFVKKPGLGWVNTYVNILQYNNFELKKVE